MGWMTRACLPLIAATAVVLCACEKPLSYEDASQKEPYRTIVDAADRRWLYDYHQTPAGAIGWLEDELRMRDAGISSIWFTSDGLLELEYPGEKIHAIKRENAVKMVRAQGAPAAARVILGEAHKAVGGYATAPDQPLVLIDGEANSRRAQRLTYPQAYERTAVIETQKLIDRARQAHQAGDVPRTIELLATAVEQRQNHLGVQHPATLEVLSTYQYVAGRPYASGQ